MVFDFHNVAWQPTARFFKDAFKCSIYVQVVPGVLIKPHYQSDKNKADTSEVVLKVKVELFSVFLAVADVELQIETCGLRDLKEKLKLMLAYVKLNYRTL